MKSSFSWLLRSCLVALIGLSLLFVVATLVIGPPPKVLAKLNGEVVFVDHKSEDLGSLRPDEERSIKFLVANLSRNPIKILQPKTSCSCTSANLAFPIMVEPFSDKSLEFTFHAPEALGSFIEYVEINSDARPNGILCRIVGSVAPKSAALLASP